jgi:hypothetical protein
VQTVESERPAPRETCLAGFCPRFALKTQPNNTCSTSDAAIPALLTAATSKVISRRKYPLRHERQDQWPSATTTNLETRRLAYVQRRQYIPSQTWRKIENEDNAIVLGKLRSKLNLQSDYSGTFNLYDGDTKMGHSFLTQTFPLRCSITLIILLTRTPPSIIS